MAEHPEPDADVTTKSSTPAETDRMREIDLDTVVRRQTPLRTRVIQGGVLLTVLLVVGGLVFRGYWAGQPQPTTVTTVTVDDFSKNVAILSNVNYGTLVVNGKKLNALPPVIVTLHAGTNTITLSAPPLQPHTCTVDMSQQSVAGAYCLGGSVSPPVSIGGKQAVMKVEIPLTLTDLPSEQQHSVEAAVAQALGGHAFHTTVPAHQYIATGVDAQGHIISRLTDEDLQADVALVRLAGQPGPSDYSCGGDICPSVIGPNVPSGLPDASNSSGTATTIWRVAIFVIAQWRFTTRTGDIAATSPLNDPSNLEIEVPLHYDAAQGWRAERSPQLDSPSAALAFMTNAQCSAGMNRLFTYVTQTNVPPNISTHANRIEGCEVQLLTGDKPVASFLWRFGVLLAADAAAHKLVPSLPVAPQAEIDAVTK